MRVPPLAPPRRASPGSAASAAAALPNCCSSARKVRGPILSLRMRRSQSSRSSSLRRTQEFAVIFNATFGKIQPVYHGLSGVAGPLFASLPGRGRFLTDLRLGAGDQPRNVAAVHDPHQHGEAHKENYEAVVIQKP